jgi:hypothetical protein
MQEYGDYLLREESVQTSKFMIEHRRMRAQEESRDEEAAERQALKKKII